MAHRVTLIPGDGTGPELTEATRRVLEATGVDFDWDVREAGVDVMEEAGTPLPETTLASVKANGVALKGPITTPIGTGFRSVNVALRHELELYACLRPCKSYAGVRSRYDDVDLVIVRENTEDLYANCVLLSAFPAAMRYAPALADISISREADALKLRAHAAIEDHDAARGPDRLESTIALGAHGMRIVFRPRSAWTSANASSSPSRPQRPVTRRSSGACPETSASSAAS